jgi:hypothetical protein
MTTQFTFFRRHKKIIFCSSRNSSIWRFKPCNQNRWVQLVRYVKSFPRFSQLHNMNSVVAHTYTLPHHTNIHSCCSWQRGQEVLSLPVEIFVARNFRILHPIIEDAESGQIWHLSTMPGAEHCYTNYSVGCSGTLYFYIHIFSSHPFLTYFHWVR